MKLTGKSVQVCTAKRYAVHQLRFNPRGHNREIAIIRRRHNDPHPQQIRLTDHEMKYYSELYEFFRKQNTTDWQQIKALESLPSVPPVIFQGSDTDRWCVDGMHRLAIAAHLGQQNVLGYQI